ncbi:MAG: hypothetical protein U0939_11395 [Pirellulales bacterium]
MKWCWGLALALIFVISATAQGQTYGSKSRTTYSGYRVQQPAEAEALPPAVEPADEPPIAPLPAPQTRVRRAEPAEGAFDHWTSGVVHDDGYYPACNQCCTGLLWRKPTCGCRPAYTACGGCATTSCCPSWWERMNCRTQANLAYMQCRIRNFNNSLWGTSGCSSCGKSTIFGGCGCSGGSGSMGEMSMDAGEVWHDGPSDPLMPRPAPPRQPAVQPHEAPGPEAPGPDAAAEPDNRPARRYVPSTVVPSAAWKWTPIRSAY